MHDFQCTNAEDMYYDRLREHVKMKEAFVCLKFGMKYARKE